MDLVPVTGDKFVNEAFPGLGRRKNSPGAADHFHSGVFAGFPNPGAGEFILVISDKFRTPETGQDIKSVFPGFADDVVGNSPVVPAAFVFCPPPVEDAVVVKTDGTETALAGPGEEFIQIHSASSEQRCFRRFVGVLRLETGALNVKQMPLIPTEKPFRNE